MKVIVDTCVWSISLRRHVVKEEMAIATMLRELITDGRVVLLGAIRQEVLSGIRYQEKPEDCLVI